jgi:hypothetical protein
MVQVSRGSLIETDVPTKVLILFFNEQCTPDKKFVIQDLDETRLFVQTSAIQTIQQQLREYHNRNTFTAPAKDGQATA